MLGKCAKKKEHDGLGKASLEHENNKKNSTYEHCNAPKAGKICSSYSFMCLLGKNFPEATRIYFLGKQIPKKWGNAFSRRGEVSSRGTLPITKYDFW